MWHDSNLRTFSGKRKPCSRVLPQQLLSSEFKPALNDTVKDILYVSFSQITGLHSGCAVCKADLHDLAVEQSSEPPSSSYRFTHLCTRRTVLELDEIQATSRHAFGLVVLCSGAPVVRSNRFKHRYPRGEISLSTPSCEVIVSDANKLFGTSEKNSWEGNSRMTSEACMKTLRRNKHGKGEAAVADW